MPRQTLTGDAAARLLRHRGGASGVEFALLLPALIVVLVGAVDVGTLTFQQMQVGAAAHAGAQYALRYGWNLLGVQAAVTGATSLAVTATPAPQLVKACVVSGVVTTTAGTTCSSGGAPGSYVLVNASASVPTLVVYATLAMPTTLTAQAMVRIQ